VGAAREDSCHDDCCTHTHTDTEEKDQQRNTRSERGDGETLSIRCLCAPPFPPSCACCILTCNSTLPDSIYSLCASAGRGEKWTEKAVPVGQRACTRARIGTIPLESEQMHTRNAHPFTSLECATDALGEGGNEKEERAAGLRAAASLSLPACRPPRSCMCVCVHVCMCVCVCMCVLRVCEMVRCADHLPWGVERRRRGKTQRKAGTVSHTRMDTRRLSAETNRQYK